MRQLEIENFRGIKEGKVVFPDHSVLFGPNNVGKSSVGEGTAEDLLPEFLSGANPGIIRPCPRSRDLCRLQSEVRGAFLELRRSSASDPESEVFPVCQTSGSSELHE
jgi:hypothetical protein